METEIKIEDFAPVISELGIDSPDKLKEFASVKDQLSTIQAERDAYLLEKENLSKQLGELQASSNGELRLADDYLEGLRDLMSKGATREEVDTYAKVANLNPSSLNEVEAKLYRLRFEKGLSEQDARFVLASNYGIVSEESADYDPDKAKVGRARLLEELRENRQYIDQAKKQMTTTEAMKLREQSKQAELAFEQALDRELPNVLKVDTINLDLTGGENPEKFALNVREEYKKEMTQLAKAYAKQEKLDLKNPEHKQLIEDHVRKSYFYFYGDEVVKQAVNHAISIAAKKGLFQGSTGYAPSAYTASPDVIVKFVPKK